VAAARDAVGLGKRNKVGHGKNSWDESREAEHCSASVTKS
jgi:hypothetical protein